MQCSQTTHSLTEITGTNSKKLDPRKILGITICGSSIYLQTLAIPARIAEKMSMTIPVMQIPTGTPVTTIKSLQLKNKLMVAEISGPASETVRSVLDALMQQMSAINMVTAFFPAGAIVKEEAQYYFGFGTNVLRPAYKNLKNIRLLDNGQGVVFTQATQLKQLSLSQINEDWVKSSIVVYEAKKEIAFLGRVQNSNVVMTLSDETTYTATVTRKQQKATVTSLSAFRQKVSAVLGTIQHGGKEVLTGIKGRELLLVQHAVNE